MKSEVNGTCGLAKEKKSHLENAAVYISSHGDPHRTIIERSRGGLAECSLPSPLEQEVNRFLFFLYVNCGCPIRP
jgi:hypothetical protein